MTDPRDPHTNTEPGGDDPFDRRLRALAADAGADAPPPPEFREAVMADRPNTPELRVDDHRRIAAILGGALAIAAALALFFLVPRGRDDALVISDTSSIAGPEPTAAPEPATTLEDESPDAPTTASPATTPDTAPTSDTALVTAVPPASVAPTTTATTTSSTAAPTTTQPGNGATPTAQAFPGVDLTEGTVFGFRAFETVDVEVVVATVGKTLGAPTSDSGVRSMADQIDCFGAVEYRVLWWGDLRLTFERYQIDGGIRDELTAWSVGQPDIIGLAPAGDVPPLDTTLVATANGVTVGSTRDDIATLGNVFDMESNRVSLVRNGTATLFQLDEAGFVIGFGVGPFDCQPNGQDR